LDLKAGFRWLNPPPDFQIRDNAIFARTAAKTDFWQDTFYGFRRDSGHFYGKPVTGDFTAEVTIHGRYEALYDQAGLMARIDDQHWVKAGIEQSDGEAYLSVVVTNAHSDWSLIKFDRAADGVRIRLTRHGEAIRVQYIDPSDGGWKLARLAYLKPAASLEIGIMCCSPKREGFEVTFRDFAIGPPISRQLHD
jgi:regulation of enolase protein 1 (concanavalin A-like superfamily)